MVKGQQFFNSFWLGSALVVLTTQAAWADTVQGSTVRLVKTANGLEVQLETPKGVSPQVSTSSYGRTWVANITNTQLQRQDSDTFRATQPADGISVVSVKPVNGNSIRVSVTGKTDLPIGQVSRRDEGIVISLTPSSPTSPQPGKNSDANSTTTREEAKNIVAPATVPNLLSVKKETGAVYNSAQMLQPIANNTTSQIPKLTTTSNRSSQEVQGVVETGGNEEKASFVSSCQFVSPSPCLLPKGTSPATSAFSALDSLGENATRRLAQAQPIPPSAPITPVPGDLDIPNQAIEVPDYLIPGPNPLLLPNLPEQVDIEGIQPITLLQALELARRNTPELQVALLTLERSLAALREARAALYPNANVNSDLTRQESAGSQLGAEQRGESPLSELLGEDSAGPTTSFSATAQLSYDIYTSGLRAARIQAAEEQARVDELDVERIAEQLRLDVSTDYYNLQGADEQVRIAQAAVENAQASLRDALALERAGVGTRFDVLRAQVNLANAQQDLTNGVSQQRIARGQLAARLNVPPSIGVSAADPVQLAGLWNPTLAESIVLAFQNRAELQQVLAQRNISQARRRAALAELGPQVSILGSYNLLDQFDDNVGITDGYSLGLRATLSLFDAGAARARAAQEQANVEIAEAQFAQQRNQVRFQVEQAFANLQANLENVQTATTAVEQAREALRLARLRFQAGVGTQTDVIAAENDLTRALGNRVEAILDYNRALANLQRSVSLNQSR